MKVFVLRNQCLKCNAPIIVEGNALDPSDTQMLCSHDIYTEMPVVHFSCGCNNANKPSKLKRTAHPIDRDTDPRVEISGTVYRNIETP